MVDDEMRTIFMVVRRMVIMMIKLRRMVMQWRLQTEGLAIPEFQRQLQEVRSTPNIFVNNIQEKVRKFI